MSKVIINNESSLSDKDAMHYVSGVISLGRISNGNTQYCYVSQFKDVIVYASLNANSDRFNVRDK